MSRDNQSSKPRHLLVFDTGALLSAKENERVQVWRNNLQLGECYIPGATYAEIGGLASNSHRLKEQAKAKEFLKFVNDGYGREYKIQPVEDNRKIPIDNQKDRQIIACAHRLARENPSAVVVLVTYEAALQGLVQQSGTANFCTLPAAKLAVWFHEDYKRGRVPQEIFDTYGRMRGNRGLPTGSQGGGNPGGRNLPNRTDESRSPRRISQEPEPRTLNPVRHSQPPRLAKDYSSIPVSPSKRSHSNLSDLLKNPIAVAAIVGVLALGIFFFARREPTSPTGSAQVPGLVSQSAAANPEPLRQTPPSSITEAETSVVEFQRTKDPATLKRSLNLLQELKNKQGARLDKEGEQSLNRLKHKYAIEVLATSGQLAEAATLLKQIPSTYSDYSAVRNWLTKQHR